MIKCWGDGSWWSGAAGWDPSRRAFEQRRDRRWFVRVAGPFKIVEWAPPMVRPTIIVDDIEFLPSVRFYARRADG